MSIQSLACQAFLLKLDKETLGKFNLPDEILESIDTIRENDPPGDCNEAVALINSFKKRWGLMPEVILISSDAEGYRRFDSTGHCRLDSAAPEPDEIYLQFENQDKYIMKLRTKWKELPVEPKTAFWTYSG